MKILVNIHHSATSNVGDRFAPPLFYFAFQGYENRVDDFNGLDRWADADAIIVGGGTLNRSRIASFVKTFRRRGKPAVGWGLGDNIGRLLSPQLSRCLARGSHWRTSRCFDLIGVRDALPRVRRVPCASCMLDLFDDPPPPTREVVFYCHDRQAREFAAPPGVPSMTNAGSTIDQAVQFLASAETIVTSSYHGVYWGALLGRRVIAYAYGTKFHHFGFSIPIPIIREVAEWTRHRYAPHGGREQLTEARALNQAFAEEVASLLGTRVRAISGGTWRRSRDRERHA